MKVTGSGAPTRAADIKGKEKSRTRIAAEAAGIDGVTFAGIPESELTPRVRAALSSLMQEVAALREELAEARARMTELANLADTDPLLSVLNRRAFVAALSRTISLVERYGQPAALVYLDVVGMKAINDTYGHHAGDRALRHVADLIQSNTRHGDIIGRLGGDEFGIILMHCDKEAAVAKIDVLVRAARETSFEVDMHRLTVDVSGGIAEVIAGGSADAVIDCADAEMYASRKRS